MNREELYFDSRDGKTKIHAVKYVPDVEIVGVLQIVHGMAEHTGRYDKFARFMAENGFVVVADDHLGHGKTAEGLQYGYFCKQDPATVVVRDVHRLKKLTQEQYPNVPYIIMGHSMGSFIVRNYICRYGTGVDGAIIMGTGMQPKALIAVSKALAGITGCICGDKHVAKFIDKLAFGAYCKKIANPRTAFDWLTKDDKVVDAYMADPYCGFTFTVNGFKTLFELISRLHKPENLSKIPSWLPIFMVSGEADPVGDYGEGVKRSMDSIKSAGVTNISLKLYDDDRHELLNETDKEVVMADILQWIKENVTGLKV